MQLLLKRCLPHLSTVVWLSLLVSAGCSSPAPTGYRTYTLTEGAGHLSFEYPARIPVRTVQLAEDGTYTMVDLYGPVSIEDRTRTRIWVTVTDNPGGQPDADLFLESARGVAETLPGYRFIDRSSLLVDGESAEQIIYANTTFRSDYETRVLRLEPVTTINRHAYVAHGNAVWTFSITASERIYDADFPDFDHLLATFKFLD